MVYRPPVHIPRIEIFLTSGCNLRCGFCVEHERLREGGWLAWGELDARIRRASDQGVGLVQFIGGEATLHPHFIDALELCKSLSLRTYVITNLLAWEDRGFAEAVAPVLDEVMISLHAWGADAGFAVTGRRDWWPRFLRASDHARATLRARIKGSTVLTRDSVADLDRIADHLLSFGPAQWITGPPVPTRGSEWDRGGHTLRLEEIRALQPRLRALRQRCEEASCKLIFFALPHCVLGPALWDDTTDTHVDGQDLSEQNDGRTAAVHFWSLDEAAPEPGVVRLGRSRAEPCRRCVRQKLCGGAFTDDLERFGADGLRPVTGPEPEE